MPLDKLSHPQQARAWFDNIPIQNQYTVGIAGEVFFRGLMDGKLLAAHCQECGRTFLPPTLYCGNCFSTSGEWREIVPRGVIDTFTVVHLDLEGNRLEQPELIALVRFEGCEGGLIHRLGEIDAAQVEVGMPVEVVFRPPQEREGSILDIAHFRPLTKS